MNKPAETELYLPIKAFLTDQGYEVRAEVGAADVVACRSDDPPVIVELKTGFSLSLFHQAIARQTITDEVYVAVARGSGRRFQQSLRRNLNLARRLGIGLITVRLSDGMVQVHANPGPYTPRKSQRRKSLLLNEFSRRRGDPNVGGSTRSNLVTAYRQDAVACARFLNTHGPSRGLLVAKATSVEKATRIMADNHYGWFVRVERGVYNLTPVGSNYLANFSAEPFISCTEA